MWAETGTRKLFFVGKRMTGKLPVLRLAAANVTCPNASMMSTVALRLTIVFCTLCKQKARQETSL